MKKLIYGFTVLSLALLGFMPAVPAKATINNGEAILYAGQNIPVGEVAVINNAVNLYVTYTITEPGWCLTESHVQIAADKAGLPNAGGKTKNLAPGLFDYSESHDCVDSYTYEIPSNYQVGNEPVVAAHAKVEKWGEKVVCEPVLTDYNHMTLEVVSDGSTYAGSIPAVAAWTHPAWTADIPGATWIWNSYLVTDPTNGEMVAFTRDFNVDGIVTSAILDIAVDNTYDSYINVLPAGSSADLNNFQLATQDQYDVTGLVGSGANTLTINASNPAWSTTDPQANPAGLLYKLTVNYDEPVYEDRCELVPILLQSESAWAATDVGQTRYNNDIKGGNWATYFTYKVEEYCPTVELIPAFEMFPGSVYDTSFTHTYANAAGTITVCSASQKITASGLTAGRTYTVYVNGIIPGTVSTAGPWQYKGTFTANVSGNGFSDLGSLPFGTYSVFINDGGTMLISYNFSL